MEYSLWKLDRKIRDNCFERRRLGSLGKVSPVSEVVGRQNQPGSEARTDDPPVALRSRSLRPRLRAEIYTCSRKSKIQIY